MNAINTIWDDRPFIELPPLLDYNLITDTDSYKPSHPVLLPSSLEYVSTYSESRGGRWKNTVYFGLQMLLMEYLTRRVNYAMIEEAQDRFGKHGIPFYREGWERIVRKHDGFLPIEIEAVPEGLVIPGQNIMTQYTNTAPGFGWLPGHIETMTLRGTWYPVTVATLSWHIKQTIREFLVATTDLEGAELEATVEYMLHDFGARGVSSRESSGIGGVSHLVNFKGTDTLRALDYAYKYYNEDMAGHSISATEHSTHILWGHEAGQEFESYNNFANQYLKPGAIAACVCDSYDLMRAVDWWGTRLKKKLIDSGAKLVIRPDSGEPTEIVPAVIKRLMGHFGYRTNKKGYDVLPDFIRVIQGDGVNEDSIRNILQVLKDDGLAANNLGAFGMGGKLLQGANRDTLKFAQKPSAAKDRNAREWRDVYKDPITDPGKMSKSGRMALVYEGGRYKTVDKDKLNGRTNILRPVFRNGQILHYHTLERIRERSNLCLSE